MAKVSGRKVPVVHTCEFVSPHHPDKICDQIADTILDAYNELDPQSRVAVEIMGGHNRITVSGEVTSRGELDVEAMVRPFVGPKFEIVLGLVKQSPQIAQGVDTGGAGDQGIMVGYACNETDSLMPLEYELARKLCFDIWSNNPYDGKTQVTTRDGKVQTVVASFQNVPGDALRRRVEDNIKAEEYFINPAGDWNLGGFDADSGLSGRKIVVDAYGPRVPVGGGSFSGKDYTKVDRSGAYMARYIAVSYLKKFGADEVIVKLAYAIGRSEPVMATALVDGHNMAIKGFDLSPGGIRKVLQLDKVQFTSTSTWGHFGRNFTWDRY